MFYSSHARINKSWQLFSDLFQLQYACWVFFAVHMDFKNRNWSKIYLERKLLFLRPHFTGRARVLVHFEAVRNRDFRKIINPKINLYSTGFVHMCFKNTTLSASFFSEKYMLKELLCCHRSLLLLRCDSKLKPYSWKLKGEIKLRTLRKRIEGSIPTERAWLPTRRGVTRSTRISPRV